MDIPESLKYRIFDKKCILFLGAGATLESGGLLAKDLGKYIFNELGDTGVNYQEDLGKYTQELVNKGFREDIEKNIRKRLKNINPNDEFKKIVNIPWKAIYTTNYDDLVEKAYKNSKYYECTVEDAEKPKFSINNSCIPLYKICGDINERYVESKPLVITLKDLKLNKFRNEAIIRRLVEDLNDTFIFLGYSFDDGIIKDILESFMKLPRWENIKEKYVILPNISDELKMDLDIYGIKYIKGTSNEFFRELNEMSDRNYQIRLRALKKVFSEKSMLNTLEPRTLNHINECFNIYNEDEQYPVDYKYFYSGGNPSWGVIKENCDVNKNIKYSENETGEKTIADIGQLVDILSNIILKNKSYKVLLRGPAVSGKSTVLYRIAYELMSRDILAMIFKQQSVYEKGTLSDIYSQINQPIVVLVDNLIIDSTQVSNMMSEVETNNIPVMFIISVRYSDWNNSISDYSKSRIKPIDLYVDLDDSISEIESEKLVNKLIDYKLITVSNKYEKNGIIKKLCKKNNLIEILLSIINRGTVSDSICSEYDILTNEAKMAYGVVSLTYQYDLKIKWELLKRTIENRYDFTWHDFINNILKGDARGNLFEEEIQGNFLIAGRHRYISKIIIDIHYKGNYSDEIQDIKRMIDAASGSLDEEIFIGTFINSIISDDKRYTEDNIIEILDYAIDRFEYDDNIAFVTHLKGEYNINNRKYKEAIGILDINVENKLNLVYSLHSLGKAYFYLAQTEECKSGEFRNHINIALDKLYQGVRQYSKNEYYYSTIINIFNYLKERNIFSERDERLENHIIQLADLNLGKDKYSELKTNFSE